MRPTQLVTAILLCTNCTIANPNYAPAAPDVDLAEEDGGEVDIQSTDTDPRPDFATIDFASADLAVNFDATRRDATASLDLVTADFTAVTPSTCSDVLAAQPGALDGLYVLYYGGDKTKSWTAYCYFSGGIPKEYLPLDATRSDHNFSQYTTKSSGSTSVRTTYTRVRIDPKTLLVDISDQTYASSSGKLLHGQTAITSMPFGTAMDCAASNVNTDSPVGVGNVDLRGTAFAVARTAFKSGGIFNAKNAATFSNNDQVVDLSGGGACGWISPDGSNPITYPKFVLQLVYR